MTAKKPASAPTYHRWNNAVAMIHEDVSRALQLIRSYALSDQEIEALNPEANILTETRAITSDAAQANLLDFTAFVVDEDGKQLKVTTGWRQLRLCWYDPKHDKLTTPASKPPADEDAEADTETVS